MMINDIKKSMVVKTYLFLLALLVLSASLSYIDGFARQSIPPAYEIKPESAEANFLTFSDFQDLRISKSTAYCEVDAKIDNGMENQYQIKTVLTNGGYADTYAMDMVAGSFFEDDMVTKHSRYAVISEELSKELFASCHCIGNALYIDDSEYTIIGVYKGQDSFWAKLSRDRYDRIYIPYTTYSDYKNLKLDALAVANDQQKAGVHKLMIEHPELTQSNINIDYSMKLRSCTQFPENIKFTVKIIILLFFLMLIYRIICTVYLFLSKQRNDFYPKEIVKKNIKIIGSALLAVSMLGCIACFIIKGLKFPLYIPGSVMPYENLFDIKHYMDMISSLLIRDNSMFMPGNNFYYLLANKTLTAQIILSIFVFIFVFLQLYAFRRLANKNPALAMELFGYFGIAFLISFALKLCADGMFFTGYTTILLFYAELLITAFLYEVSIEFLRKFNLS